MKPSGVLPNSNAPTSLPSPPEAAIGAPTGRGAFRSSAVVLNRKPQSITGLPGKGACVGRPEPFWASGPRWACKGEATVPIRLKRSEEHTSELQSLRHLVCRLLLE